MGNKTEISRAQEYRLRVLIERMQRQGMSEREITEAVREASADAKAD
jgi:hypothetical protein